MIPGFAEQTIPEHFADAFQERWGNFCAQLDAAEAEALAGLAEICAHSWAQIPLVWTGSRFVAEHCCRYPSMLIDLLKSGDLTEVYGPNELVGKLVECCNDAETLEQVAQRMRKFRNREMVRIIWRDFSRSATMEQTTGDLSALADACLDLGLQRCYADQCRRFGEPFDAEGQTAQRMVVIGMGKLGAHELNLSSDIDLIFAYPETGETSGDKSLSNSEFFTRVAQQLIKLLDAPGADGFVFRVDMRLRPYGDSGALVLSFDAMEEYYQDQGRDWERYAMIKARVCAGDVGEGSRLLQMLRPFTYRRYLDYSAIESLRSMKSMINREVARRGRSSDIKLGSGGIREIEFIVQSFQLLRGGRLTELQTPRLLTALQMLSSLALLPESFCTQLEQAYRFLRNVEHALQGYNDEQTQSLPEDENGRMRIALVLGFNDWDAFHETLEMHREFVRYQFAELIAEPAGDERESRIAEHWIALWNGSLSEDESLRVFQDASYEDAQGSYRQLSSLRDSRRLSMLQQIGRERVDAFFPLLLTELEGTDSPSKTLLRILPLVESVMRRSAYVVLLTENPVARKQLLALCGKSPWVAQQLASHPVLLDELLDPASLHRLPDREFLRSDLQQQMLRIPWEDQEAQMEGLRYFKLAHTLRVAACELSGMLPLMQVSDYLTFIAEVVLEHVLLAAWKQLIARHGSPAVRGADSQEIPFLVVAYGKLGGIELGYGSDLDLVFVHDAELNLSTDGERSIENSVFFTRLGQRIIHILNTATALGTLYEVDMRLRPSGASGLLVSSISSFEDYQQHNAWTWEHQALVRARPVAGSQRLARAFEGIRNEILATERNADVLAREVVEMREKMREHLLPAGSEEQNAKCFHIKHSAGGIVDIEFMVQYAVLRWSAEYPALCDFTDNIRVLERLAGASLFSLEEVEALTDAYKAFRSEAHRLALEQEDEMFDPSEVAHLRDPVLNKWQQLFGKVNLDE